MSVTSVEIPTDGSAADISELGSLKSLAASGDFTSTLVLEISHDGVIYDKIAQIVRNQPVLELEFIALFARIIVVGGTAGSAEVFLSANDAETSATQSSISVPSAPLTGPSTDISELGEVKTLIIDGDILAEQIVIEVGNNGTFSPVAAFRSIDEGPITIKGFWQNVRARVIGYRYGSATLQIAGFEDTNVDEDLWFEWNGVDLTQFDEKVQGSAVDSSSVSVVEVGGLNWIRIDVDGGVGGSISTNSVHLPISTLPPTANYVITAEFLNELANSSVMGAMLCTRFANISNFYTARAVLRGANGQDLYKIVAGASTQLGPTMGDPPLNGPNQGFEFSCGVLGQIVRANFGEGLHVLDTALAAAGKATIATGSGSANIAIRNIFRNIRCFTLNP